jgi:peroxin-6
VSGIEAKTRRSGAMAASNLVVEPQRRRRRRRRQDKPAISAKLVLDDRVKGDAGILSEDLFTDLFPERREGEKPSTCACDELY